jgi:hypothetical protein
LRAVAPGAAPLAYVDRRADGRAGGIDDERLGAALESLLAERRRRGLPVEEALANGAIIVVTSAPGGRVKARLGWVDGWDGENARGRGISLGVLELADLVRAA